MKFSCKPCIYKKVSQGYSSNHKGIDLANSKGTPIYAVADGTIVAASYGAWDKSYGNEVAIYHGNGNYTNYAHLSKISIKNGQKVKAGTKIGEMGSTGNSTGNHLHFELHISKKWNRVNPKTYIDGAGKISTISSNGYTVGKTYTLQANMNVRSGAGTNYAKKKRNELTADAKKHSTVTGTLKKGTRVTCKAVKKTGSDIWIQIPSGWICAKKGNKVYIK